MTAARSRSKKLIVGMTAVLGMSCHGGMDNEAEQGGPEQAGSQALTSAEIDRVLGFENVADWRVMSGGQGILTSSSTHTEGSKSLGVIGVNYIPIQSIALSSLGTRVQQHLQYDVRLPTTQPNPDYFGTTQVFLDCPSRNLYNAYVGQVELNYFPLGEWWTVDLTLSNTMVNALQGTYSDLRIVVVLNIPYNATGTYLIDNLRFSATAAPPGPCDAGNYSPKAAGTVCRAASGECDVAETCSGRSLACASDGFKSAGTMCRALAGVCDVAEVCNGTSAACPSDVFLDTSVICRPTAGVCDSAESCTGTSAACPPDGFAPSTEICRPAVDGCDVAELCTGSGTECPPDGRFVVPPVTNLVALAGSNNVGLTWTGFTGARAYNVKRSISSSGPFNYVTSVSETSYTDELRAIGPTYYYVVTTLTPCGESEPSSIVSAAPFGSKTGTMPPGPGGLKMEPGLVIVPTTAEVVARYGSAAMADPSTIPGTVGTGTKVRKVAHALSSSRYARVRYEMKTQGTSTLITPLFAIQMEGPLVRPSTVSGEILVVGRSNGAVNFVSTIKDPRLKTSFEAPGMATGRKDLREDGGWLLVDLPESFVASDKLLGGTVFEFYSLNPSVPVTTPVSVQSLPTLMSGATLIAKSSGSSLLPRLFPGQ